MPREKDHKAWRLSASTGWIPWESSEKILVDRRDARLKNSLGWHRSPFLSFSRSNIEFSFRSGSHSGWPQGKAEECGVCFYFFPGSRGILKFVPSFVHGRHGEQMWSLMVTSPGYLRHGIPSHPIILTPHGRLISIWHRGRIYATPHHSAYFLVVKELWFFGGSSVPNSSYLLSWLRRCMASQHPWAPLCASNWGPVGTVHSDEICSLSEPVHTRPCAHPEQLVCHLKYYSRQMLLYLEGMSTGLHSTKWKINNSDGTVQL